MSSPARLLLASADSTGLSASYVQALELAAREEGLVVAVVTGTPIDREARELVAAAVGVPLAFVGADPVVAEAWSALPGLALVSLMVRAERALADPDTDLVVVDVGDLDDMRTLASLPDTLVRLLDALMTARLAVLRRPSEAADDARGTGPSTEIFDIVGDVRRTVLRWVDRLQREGTVARVAVRAGAVRAREVGALVDDLLLLGVEVDGVVVCDVASQKDSKRDALADRDYVRKVEARVGPVACWKSPRERVRAAPKGYSVAGPLDSQAVPLRSTSLGVAADDDGFTLTMPVPSGACARVRIGVQGDSLVMDAGSATRWLELPSVLRRCTAVEGVAGPHDVSVRWQPDPAVWPTAMAPTGGGR